MNCSFDGKGVKRSRWKEEINKNIYIGKHIQKTPNKNIQTSERKKHITRSINYEKKFSFGKIQHDIHWEEFAPLSVTSGNLSNEYCESEKISHIRHFKCWQRLIPVSQSSPSNPGGQEHRYPLSVNPATQVALFWHWELLSQAFWRRERKKKIPTDRL